MKSTHAHRQLFTQYFGKKHEKGFPYPSPPTQLIKKADLLINFPTKLIHYISFSNGKGASSSSCVSLEGWGLGEGSIIFILYQVPSVCMSSASF